MLIPLVRLQQAQFTIIQVALHKVFVKILVAALSEHHVNARTIRSHEISQPKVSLAVVTTIRSRPRLFQSAAAILLSIINPGPKVQHIEAGSIGLMSGSYFSWADW